MILHTAIYRFGIAAYTLAIRLASLFNNKARLFIMGRKDIIYRIRQTMASEKRPVIWMHCASLGEFEQGRPVLEALRAQYPGYAYVLTFFSPSGYEVRKGYEGADHIFYLPMDTPANAHAFLDAVKPSLCLFVKYEFWYYYLSRIRKTQIPALLLSAIFKKDQGFFSWYGGLQREMLRSFTHLFVQDQMSVSLLHSIGIDNVTVTGDTRFDRVVVASDNSPELSVAARFSSGHKVIVAGSTWWEDEVFLGKFLKINDLNFRLIIVPHEIDNEHIVKIEKLFSGKLVKWSACGEDTLAGSEIKVLLVDKVGLLLHLYKYGQYAWIGGGFGKDGVHNVLEAAVYGMPCFYGPVFHRFIEAEQLVNEGGAVTLSDPKELATWLHKMEDELVYRHHADAARRFVLSGAGATEKVLDHIRRMNITGIS